MRKVLIALALMPAMASAQVYKCSGADGKVAFSDRPCAGAATKQEAVTVKAPPVQNESRPAAASADNWEEMQRFRYVDIPARERQAAELMASGDPQKEAIGKEMAWKVHQAKEEFERAKRARESRAEIEERYDRALRQIRGY